jgi:hypothetical protein
MTTQEKPIPVAASWGAPFARWLSDLSALSGSPREKLSDLQFLARLDALAAALPGLLDHMDHAALAAALEQGMAAGILDGARFALAKVPGLRSMVYGLKSPPLLPLAAAVAVGPLPEAVAKLDRKTPLGSKLSSWEWSKVPLEIRERSQFSAKVESARFLQEAQDRLHAGLSLARQKVENGEALMDRSVFISEMRQIAEEEGINTTGAAGQGTVRDIRSAKRLGLIWDMQTNQAQEFSRWKMDQDPDVLNAYPAQRFVRIEDRLHPREDWPNRWDAAAGAVDFEGVAQNTREMVALKTSPIWAELSVFGTPWPPFDFGSGMGLEDVSRAEAVDFGLVDPNEDLVPIEEDFNASLEAGISDLSSVFLDWLKSAFGNQVEIDKGKIYFAPPKP